MFQDFLDGTRKHYDAELESVNFIAEFEAARLNINNWVETQTQGGSSRYTLKWILELWHVATRIFLYVSTLSFRENQGCAGPGCVGQHDQAGAC